MRLLRSEPEINILMCRAKRRRLRTRFKISVGKRKDFLIQYKLNLTNPNPFNIGFPIGIGKSKVKYMVAYQI